MSDIALYIDDELQHVEWQSNEAVQHLMDLLKEKDITISMERYSNNEQVGFIGHRLSSSDTQMNTVPGDIVLYESSYIVIFYDTHQWSYSKLGHIKEKTHEDLRALLESKDVEIRLSLNQ